MPKRSKNSKPSVKSLAPQVLLHVAKIAARRAGEMSLRGYESFRRQSGQHFKKNQELVTEYDVKIEHLIRHAIRQHFPDHQIQGEEGGTSGKASRYLWQIDPIDGTTNFTIHNPSFAISIGVQYMGTPIVGVVYIPVSKQLYWAIDGQGAYCNTTRISVSGEKKLTQSVISFEFSHDNSYNRQSLKLFADWRLRKIKCRSFGSAAIAACAVAHGYIEAAILSQVMPWDIASGGLIVREAGGVMTDLVGQTLPRYDRTIVMSNGLVHQQLIAKVVR